MNFRDIYLPIFAQYTRTFILDIFRLAQKIRFSIEHPNFVYWCLNNVHIEYFRKINKIYIKNI